MISEVNFIGVPLLRLKTRLTGQKGRYSWRQTASDQSMWSHGHARWRLRINFTSTFKVFTLILTFRVGFETLCRLARAWICLFKLEHNYKISFCCVRRADNFLEFCNYSASCTFIAKFYFHSQIFDGKTAMFSYFSGAASVWTPLNYLTKMFNSVFSGPKIMGVSRNTSLKKLMRAFLVTFWIHRTACRGIPASLVN